MKSPKVTVLMPVYNAEKYLYKAIKSILDQTYRDFEFCIINDCSTDSSRDIITSFAERDDRIKLIDNNENKGCAGSLVIGMHEAQAPYIARMDADDIAYPKRLQKQIDFMEKNPDVDVLGTAIKYIHRPFSGTISMVESDAEIRAAFLFRNCLNHPTVFLRKETFLKNNLFYDTSSKIEDYELWTRGVKELTFANINEPLLHYRRVGTNMSHSLKFDDRYMSQVQEAKLRILKNYFPEMLDHKAVPLLFTKGSKGEWSVNELLEVEAFCEKISSLNRSKGELDPFYFEKELAKRYYTILSDARSLGKKMWERVTLSFLAKENMLTSSEKQKLWFYAMVKR